MTAPGPRNLKPIEPKRLHLIMRDSTLLEGEIFIGEDASLVQYLGNRKGGWMNMVRARRPKYDELPGHLIVQTDHVVLASAPDGNVLVLGPAGVAALERSVEIVLIGGATVKGVLPMAPQRRLSDYLNSSGRFVGVKSAMLAADGRALGDVVIHASAITILREARDSGDQPVDAGD